MMHRLLLLQRRLFCSKPSQTRPDHNHNHPWSVKQVTKSNFADSLEDLKSHISSSDFIAVSLQNSGSFSAPWHRVSPFDTPYTAYLKAKHAAQRFQILQFALCPFSFTSSNLTAHPYNFHLFPRDELKLGLPAYSFSCQAASLKAMAREGFDFNACISNGISYLSREQEPAAKLRMGNPIVAGRVQKSSSTPTVADSVFVQRVRSRIKNWKNACKGSVSKADDALLKSLRSLVTGNEDFDSRPSMSIDVCSEQQVQLVVEMLHEMADDLVALIIPAKGGQTRAVRAVLTTSKDDKDLLLRKLQGLEDEQNKKVRGFREVIDMISASKKPIISHNSLQDLTFIHSKFLTPLPPSMDEFMHSLSLAFPQVIDVKHLMKEIGLKREAAHIPSAMSYLKNRLFAPVDVEISSQENEGNIHGHNAVRICQLFGMLSNILKIDRNTVPSDENRTLEAYANTFSPFFIDQEEPNGDDIRIWTNNSQKVSCQDVVFLWGFSGTLTAGALKNLLRESHAVFGDEFDVRLVEKSCAILVFRQPGVSRTFLTIMNSVDICGPLRDMVAEGLRAAGYETYNRACRLGLWEASLADSLDQALTDPECSSEADTPTKSSDSYLCTEWMVNLDDL
ncbi:hypothetical protein Tsubulata_024957 [Turnera subulata]|uniref:Uncharacterized protein n=1 Tax=Turnera subulata TaxID=218843 RepID=A0A9Q0FKU7_9ROSI|nr:hypothetical protein Tsubulata_024957 [Turnera subulata]